MGWCGWGSGYGRRSGTAAGYRVRRLRDARAGGDRRAGGWAGGGRGGRGRRRSQTRGAADAGGRDAGPAGWGVGGDGAGRGAVAVRGGAGGGAGAGRGAGRYDAVFLDLLGEPAQLGLLRARGLVTADTVAAVAFADHRVASAAELRQRCGFWGAIVPGDGDQVDVPGGGAADSTARSAEKEVRSGTCAGRRAAWVRRGRGGCW